MCSITQTLSPTANKAQMFCEDCRTIDRKELFSKNLIFGVGDFGDWSRFQYSSPSEICMYSGVWQGTGYRILSSSMLCFVPITPRRRNGQRVFPPYLW